jgi:G8 domain/Right handed beta helix region
MHNFIYGRFSARHSGLIATLFLGSLISGCGSVDNRLQQSPVVEAASPATEATEVMEASFKELSQRTAPIIRDEPPSLNAAQRWSDPKTWGGTKPTQGANVVIPSGKTILLDESPPPLGSLSIEGELIAEDGKSLALSTSYTKVSGAFSAGTASKRFSGQLTLTFTARNPLESINGMGTRALFVHGGALELFGQLPLPIQSKLNDHAAAGARTLTLNDKTNWKNGDQIVVAPTDYFGVSTTERIEVDYSADKKTYLKQSLQTPRWGKLQYVTLQGMSLTPPSGFSPRTLGTPSELDERAVVANLTRNIIIQGDDDVLWKDNGFGAQVMIMGSNSKTQIDSVEFRRVGQAGKLGRYPIHFHQLSYDASTGDEIVSSGTRRVSNSSIANSKNRCITLHGTNDSLIENNVCYDIAGHAIFLEDAVERRNQILNNLVLKVRVPQSPVLESDSVSNLRGPAGFWLTNPDNIVRGNRVGDSEGNGFWLAFPEKALGINALAKNGNMLMRPLSMKLKIFDENIAHSNNQPGIVIGMGPTNNAGRTDMSGYTPTYDEAALRPDHSNKMSFKMEKITTFKNRVFGFWHSTGLPEYSQWISADNESTSFAGRTDNASLTKSLVIGVSLNNATTWRSIPNGLAPVAFASYHSTLNLIGNTIVDFPYIANTPSGTFRTDDYYLQPVERGMARNTNNERINAHPGYRAPVRTNENWTLAGAIWDPYGHFGTAGNYWTFNDPFLTAGAQCQPVDAPNNALGSNGMSCNSEYYGVSDFLIENSIRFLPTMPIKVSRIDLTGTTLGQWSVREGTFGNALFNMRHFAAMRNGRYILEFADSAGTKAPIIPAEFLQMSISNNYRPSDEFLLAVPFSGTANPKVILRRPYSSVVLRSLTSATSLADAEASAGTKFWQDKKSNRIWINVKYTNETGDPSLTATDDMNLYRNFELRIDK